MKVESKKVVKNAGGRKVAPKKVAEEKPDSDGLTTKQRLFVEAYLSNGFNATEAARVAGYQGNANVLGVTGHANLRNPKIAGLVAERINEAAMPVNEVLARLSAIARGKVTDFEDESGKFDLEKARKANKDGLIKKLKRKRTSKRVDARTEGNDEEAEIIETSLVYEEIEFEMYSAHEALRDLGKYHKLFTDKTEHSGEVRILTEADLTDEQLKDIATGAR